LELRSRIEYLEETLKEIAYDQLTTLSQELQGNEYKTLVTKDQAHAALWGLLSGGDNTKEFFQDIETLLFLYQTTTMTDNNHPITPPPELVETWIREAKPQRTDVCPSCSHGLHAGAPINN